ncbi:MAG: hypothetical protein NZ958_05110 [Bacteroidia bacterium]|nr:hypothetical protein [Bacteroidia bacterium]MDW8089038.1 hypothetical protein [Bacteroidia bacterium]
MKEWLTAYEKFPTTVAVILIIWVALLGYMSYLTWRMHILEKTLRNRN